MKLNGKVVTGVNYEYIVIPRPDGDLVFKAEAVLDMKPFHDMCPVPKPAKIMLPGGEQKEDMNDATYKAAVSQYSEKRYAFIVISSLKATPTLEWETVQYTDPSTWLNWSEEMKAAKFTTNEINLIQLGVATANSLNQEKLDEARARFLVSLAVDISAP